VAQHDYIISNQSGAAFRGDLNNGLAAIVSQNSGATQPSTTYAYQWWADTTTGLLKIRNAANSAWITVGTLADANLGLLSLAGGTLTGAVLADDAGTAALPAIAFDGDTNTGIFRKGADQLGLSTGGTERGFIDSNGVTIQAQGDLRLADSDSSNWVALQAPATVATNLTLTAPAADGTADQSLVTDGTGVLSFASRSRLVRATAVATTSGTSIDFTSIPSWVRRITVVFTSVSTSGTSPVQIQIGDSGGVETTGYTGTAVAITSSSTLSIASYTSGAVLIGLLTTTVRSGSMVITNIDGNQWQFSSIHTNDDVAFLGWVSAIKTLSATLDRVRLTTINGTDTFDAGLANIIYEG
jgi:hypothetical protein